MLLGAALALAGALVPRSAQCRRQLLVRVRVPILPARRGRAALVVAPASGLLRPPVVYGGGVFIVQYYGGYGRGYYGGRRLSIGRPGHIRRPGHYGGGGSYPPRLPLTRPAGRAAIASAASPGRVPLTESGCSNICQARVPAATETEGAHTRRGRDVLAEEGLTRASLRAITVRRGSTSPAVDYHFGSKEATARSGSSPAAPSR